MRLGLLQVEFSFLSALEHPLGDLVAAFLNGHVFTRDGDPQLGRAVRKVETGGLGTEQYLGIPLIIDGGEEGGVGRFDAAPETAPEIEFPA